MKSTMSKSGYLRISFPKLIPQLKKKIYLDGNTLIFKNFLEM